MKHLNFLAVALMAGMNLQAQHYVNLCFTAHMQGGSFQALDSVKITNVTRGWTETLYYPDTVLQLTNQTGITETKNRQNSLLQNVPNPFNGSTKVNLQLSKQEKVCLTLYDLSGKQCAVYTGSLSAGEHAFKISVGVAQAYILNLKTSEGEQSIKLSANQGGTNFQLTYTGYITQMTEKQSQKANTENEFQTGDNMKFIGYTTYDSTKRTHQLSTSQSGNNADYTFQFAIGYAVGDVYYNKNGTAEGVVCWIADTVFSKSGKYYGLYGKMISMDESDKKMYATKRLTTGALDSVDGRVNTALHMALRSDTSAYLFKERIEAAKWCTDKGSGWYFPAKCEMMMVFDNIEILNNAFQNNAGTIIRDILNGGIFWTSTEKEGWQYAYTIYIHENKIKICNSDFYETYFVRAMKWFYEPENN